MSEAAAAPWPCDCGTQVAPAMLACPACARLVHGPELARRAAVARDKEGAGDLPGALAEWRRVIALIPARTRQSEAAGAAIARLSAAVPQTPVETAPPGWARRLGPLGAVAFGVWKLAGIAKLASILSLLASFALYWRTWGLAFGGGLLACIWLHEMGHVVALRRAGIPASAPMFVPGLGAYVRMHRAPPDAGTDARVGLAGPLAGLLVAALCHLAWRGGGSDLLRALAHAGAVINLFNLVPVWSLDGARGLRALAQWQRFILAFFIGGAWALTREGMLLLLLIVAVVRALSPHAPERADAGALAWYAALVAGLSAIAFSAR